MSAAATARPRSSWHRLTPPRNSSASTTMSPPSCRRGRLQKRPVSMPGFDCLHDMGDPVGASAHIRQTLKKDGTWMIVEPFANDRLEENVNPVGRIYYSASTFICTPASRSQEVGLCLG